MFILFLFYLFMLISITRCYGLNCYPQNLYVEVLNPNVMMGLGDGAFGRALGLDEVMKVGSS